MHIVQLLESLHDMSACKGAHPNCIEKINVIMTLRGEGV